MARTLRFEPGTIVVFDRGFTDYVWFSSPGAVINNEADPKELEKLLWSKVEILA